MTSASLPAQAPVFPASAPAHQSPRGVFAVGGAVGAGDVGAFAHAQCQRFLVVKLLLRSLFPLFLALLLVFYSVYHYHSGDPCDEVLPAPKSKISSCSEDQASVTMPIQQVRGKPSAEYEILVHNTGLRPTSRSYIKAARKLRTARRPNMDRFSKIFQGLLDEGLLKIGHTVLCLGASAGEEMVALKEKGVANVIGVDLTPSSRDSRTALEPRFADGTFDFEFSAEFDNVHHPALFVAEIERTLKAGGLAAMHVSLATWRDRFMASEFGNRIKPVTLLFHHSEIVYVSTAYAPGLDTIIVFKKNPFLKVMEIPATQVGSKHGDHSISEVSQPEPLLKEEGRKSMEGHIETVVYPDEWIDKHGSSVYIDVGGRDADFSIGSWFRTRYPKNGHQFKILVMEAGDSFQASYLEVSFRQYAAWIRREIAGIEEIFHSSNVRSHFHGSAGIENHNGEMVALTVEGLDFADWLKEAVEENDFVVVKMDVKGTQFDLVSRMLETGAKFLMDEIFLVCHDHIDWKGIISKAAYDRPYTECSTLYHTLRSNGISVHQWW